MEQPKDLAKEMLKLSSEARDYLLDQSAALFIEMNKSKEMETNWLGATETHIKERMRSDLMEKQCSELWGLLGSEEIKNRHIEERRALYFGQN
jgi:hypothetical protein